MTGARPHVSAGPPSKRRKYAGLPPSAHPNRYPANAGTEVDLPHHRPSGPSDVGRMGILQCKERRCRFNFDRAEDYIKHMKTIHRVSSISDIECPLCNRTNDQLLLFHLYKHTGQRHKCKKCGEEFIRPSHLKRHMESKHKCRDGLECRYCGRTLARKDSLERHMEKVHKYE